MKKQSVDIVIVTFNRLEKLRHALSCYNGQTAHFRNIIVVDNCSTDGTKAFLSSWEKRTTVYGKYVIRMPKNTGGAGGFFEGQRFATSLNPDWILLADDDAYLYPDALEKFYMFIESNEQINFVAVGAAVLDRNGQYALHHRKRRVIQYGFKYSEQMSTIRDYEKPYFDIDSFSYVGIIINVNVLREVGYDNPNYFIYYDDTEHSIRIREQGRILCVPSIRIKHDEGFEDVKMKNICITWRLYYLVRNSIHCQKKHFFLCSVWSTLVVLKSIFLNKNKIGAKELPVYRKMVVSAISDAWTGSLGIHAKYKPGYDAC